MPLIQTDSQHYSDIADAIRDMSGNEETFYPSEMAAGVRSIPQTIAIQPIIYSLEEREVGVWTDGKPLYQKSFECSISVGSSWVNTNITLENVDKLIHCYGGNKWGSGSNGTAVYNIMADMTSNNKIELCIPGWSAGVKYFTLLYTKTTDTPGSGTWTPSGVPAHHYSTEEQVIGTWVDGKPLYENVLYFNQPFEFVTTNTWTETPFNASGIEEIIMGRLQDGSGCNSCISTGIRNGKIALNSPRAISYGSTIKLIIQYTKTTD